MINMNPILVGSRASKLAIIQIEEVYSGLRFYHPDVRFKIKCTQTTGDLDQKTSLIELGQTDFFTKELDEALIKGELDVCIHSAKDLPEPLPEGLEVIALTQCKNNQDVLVISKGKKLADLAKRAKIGASSHRRIEGVEKLLPYAKCIDLRGTIEKRLSNLTQKKLDGVVIAKVALQRLGLNDLNCVDLDIETPKLQGSLAIVARKNDERMRSLFSCIDARKDQKILYLGLNPSRFLGQGPITHAPIIKTEPLPIKDKIRFFKELTDATHLLLTSQESVKYFFEILNSFHLDQSRVMGKSIIAVGMATRALLIQHGFAVDYTPSNESQEGLIDLFKAIDLTKAHIFYPHSSKARLSLIQYFEESSTSFYDVSVYNTDINDDFDSEVRPEEYDQIVFTSPTCVKYYFDTFSSLPPEDKCLFIGQVTHKYFKDFLITIN